MFLKVAEENTVDVEDELKRNKLDEMADGKISANDHSNFVHIYLDRLVNKINLVSVHQICYCFHFELLFSTF